MQKKLTDENRILFLRRVGFALALTVIAAVQNTDGILCSPFGLRAMPLIPALVCIAMFEREMSGLLFGLYAGALWDAVSVSGGSFNAVMLMVTGFACGALISRIMRNNLITALLLCGIATFTHELFYWMRVYIFDSNFSGAMSFFAFYLPSCLYTMLFLPLFYFLTRAAMRKGQ